MVSSSRARKRKETSCHITDAYKAVRDGALDVGSEGFQHIIFMLWHGLICPFFCGHSYEGLLPGHACQMEKKVSRKITFILTGCVICLHR